MLLQSEKLVESVDMFTELSALYIKLEPSCCHNMVKYLKETTIYWYKILKTKLARYLFFKYFNSVKCYQLHSSFL